MGKRHNGGFTEEEEQATNEDAHLLSQRKPEGHKRFRYSH